MISLKTHQDEILWTDFYIGFIFGFIFGFIGLFNKMIN
jgi:hypothetical protein